MIEHPNSSPKETLSHLPIGMALLSSASGSLGHYGKRSKKTKLKPLVKEGQDRSQFFNTLAGRPYPHMVRLEQQITVVDTYNIGAFITTSITVPVGIGLAFLLNQFAGYTSYTALFDQYRFDQIEVWLEPTAGQSTTLFGPLVTAVDLDDSNNPASLAALQDKQGALVGDGGAGRYHCFRPHVAVAEYSGAFSSFGNIPATWVDASSPAVQHYGFKAVTGPTPASIVYNLSVRAVISFRAPGL